MLAHSEEVEPSLEKGVGSLQTANHPLDHNTRERQLFLLISFSVDQRSLCGIEQIPPPPADFVEWANTTLFGAYLGAMIMGTREAVRVRYEPLPPSIMRANAQNMKLYNVYRVCRKYVLRLRYTKV
jgi:hypothetical protein